MASFRSLLVSGKTILGMFLQIPASEIAEILGISGFDCAIADVEHGMFGIDAGLSIVRACDAVGIASIYRVPAVEPHRITQALDFGASAVMVPNIHKAEEAELAVQSAKYHPRGKRGVCPFTRGARYNSVGDLDYYNRSNRETCILLQIEAEDGIANLDEIMEVPNIDCIFIGPFDLSHALGIPGRITDERVLNAIKAIAKKTERKGIALGNFPVTFEQARLYRGMGVRFLAYGADTLIISETFRSIRNEILGPT
ncbi:MAG: aldolase/citrate lyase family protein [Spirochaetota bacterium]